MAGKNEDDGRTSNANEIRDTLPFRYSRLPFRQVRPPFRHVQHPFRQVQHPFRQVLCHSRHPLLSFPTFLIGNPEFFPSRAT